MATLKDVAREAGLSVGTVSRVLNNRGYISDETRESVNSAMTKLNYQPNEMARSLSKQKNNTIGVIVPSIDHPYFAKLISCLEQAASRAQYKILLFCSRGKVKREEEYVKACRSNRVAGLILCTGNIETAKLKNLGFPVVTYERLLNSGDAGVECDNVEGGRLAAEELIGSGCRHPVIIRGTSDVSMPADTRKDGFMEGCRNAGVEGRDYSIRPERLDDLDYYQDIRNLLDENPDTDGIFAGSDIIAAQAIRVCHERGIRVPEDIKIVGYDDVPVASLTVPSITTVHQPVSEMADACIRIILNAAEGRKPPARTTFHVSLVKRETT